MSSPLFAAYAIFCFVKSMLRPTIRNVTQLTRNHVLVSSDFDSTHRIISRDDLLLSDLLVFCLFVVVVFLSLMVLLLLLLLSLFLRFLANAVIDIL